MSAWNIRILALVALALPAAGVRAEGIDITIDSSGAVTAQDGSTFFSVFSVYQIDTMEGQTNVPLTLMNQFEIGTSGLVAPSAANGPFPEAFGATVDAGVFDTVGSFNSFTMVPVGFDLFLNTADTNSPGTMFTDGTPFDIGLVSTSTGDSVDVTVNDERTLITNVPDQMPTLLGLGMGALLILGIAQRRQLVPIR